MQSLLTFKGKRFTASLKNTVFITDAVETIINTTNQNLNYSVTLDIIS